jgi:hypothetical protein
LGNDAPNILQWVAWSKFLVAVGGQGAGREPQESVDRQAASAGAAQRWVKRW